MKNIQIREDYVLKGIGYILLAPIVYYLMHFPVAFIMELIRPEHINREFINNPIVIIAWPIYGFVLFLVGFIIVGLSMAVLLCTGFLISSLRLSGAWLGIQLSLWNKSQRYMKELSQKLDEPSFIKHGYIKSTKEEAKETLLGIFAFTIFGSLVYQITKKFSFEEISTSFLIAIIFIFVGHFIANNDIKKMLKNGIKIVYTALLTHLSYLGKNGPIKTLSTCKETTKGQKETNNEQSNRK